MWDSNSPNGEKVLPKPADAWQSGLAKFKVKVDVGDFIEESVAEHLWENHNDWCEGDGDGVVIQTGGKVFMYVNVIASNGKIEIVGLNGHPLDTTKRFK